MSKAEKFKQHITEGYTFKGDSLILGAAMLDGEPIQGAQVKIPLKTLNRHGLIAGATGTGKTKTLQVLAEQMAMNGIPTLLMDIKGDLSGLAQPGELNDHITWRQDAIGVEYSPEKMLVELLTISNETGVRMRATVSEFGPVLLGKMLELNDTQEGILSILFKYCDDNKLPILDLKDLRKSLQYISGEGKKEIEKEYGRVSPASIGTIMRKIVGLEQQGAEQFFGETSFDVKDLLFTNKAGKGQVSIIRLADIQSKPKLFSTFMLSLLAEIYETFPEAGDSDKPKLCIFIDEAHLMFNEASDALLDQIEIIIKLIRSKGVGIYFCTQLPTDIPDEVLSQLGLKVQHALRAFTAKDRKAIKQTAENYPISDFYDTDQIITELGIGEALITGLNEKGIPTPLSATLLQAPKTRMDVLTPVEMNDIVEYSTLTSKYNKEIDRESAYEILTEKIDRVNEEELQEKRRIQQEKEDKQLEKERAKEAKSRERKRKTTTRKRPKTRRRTSDSLQTTVVRELTRGIFNILGI
jgi:DNA helicase HerA-like ATPase